MLFVPLPARECPRYFCEADQGRLTRVRFSGLGTISPAVHRRTGLFDARHWFTMTTMKDELFNELVASVREGGAILRGKSAPARSFKIDAPNIKKIRAGYKLSQQEFSALLGISIATLRNWEQGRRVPEGPAKILLQVAARHPDVVWDVVKRSTA
jgi:putative transcriptional regulator